VAFYFGAAAERRFYFSKAIAVVDFYTSRPLLFARQQQQQQQRLHFRLTMVDGIRSIAGNVLMVSLSMLLTA
jgi:hypothetical protein